MRFWPAWEKEIADNPPRGFSPRFWRFYARLMAFDRVLGIALAALFVGLAVGLLIAVLLGYR